MPYYESPYAIFKLPGNDSSRISFYDRQNKLGGITFLLMSEWFKSKTDFECQCCLFDKIVDKKGNVLGAIMPLTMVQRSRYSY